MCVYNGKSGPSCNVYVCVQTTVEQRTRQVVDSTQLTLTLALSYAMSTCHHNDWLGGVALSIKLIC